jgi:hypothetical protein
MCAQRGCVTCDKETGAPCRIPPVSRSSCCVFAALAHQLVNGPQHRPTGLLRSPFRFLVRRAGNEVEALEQAGQRLMYSGTERTGLSGDAGLH